MLLQGARGSDGTSAAQMFVCPSSGYRRLAGSEPKARSALRSQKRGGWPYRDVGMLAVRFPVQVHAGQSRLAFLVRAWREARSARGGRAATSPARRAKLVAGRVEKINHPGAAASGRPATRWASSRKPLIKLGGHAERREGSGFTCAPGESGGGECGEDKPPSSCSLRPAGDAMGLFAETLN